MASNPEYIQSELPAIELLKKLGYAHSEGKDLVRESISEVLLKDRVMAAIQRLNPWINTANCDKAYQHISNVQGASLMEINEKIWKTLRSAEFGVKQVIAGKTENKPVRYLDWEHPQNNDFLVVSQMRFKGEAQNSIPDLVVYINGFPIAVVECKSHGAANHDHEAIRDLQGYQKNSPKLFHYNQICLGLWGTGGKYGAIESPEQFYSFYRPEEGEDLSFLGSDPTGQDILLYALFRPAVIIDFIRHFVLFEKENGKVIKKLPRYQQIRATNKTIARLQNERGGVVWHTQGSGKSITMAYISRKLRAPEYGFDNPTILILTDRIDLDDQISKTLNNLSFKNVRRANSVASLKALLSNDYGSIITSTLQKFQVSDEDAEADFDQTTEVEQHEEGTFKIEREIEDGHLIRISKIKVNGKWEELERESILLQKISEKENFIVLVDEAHRSQYGFLAAFMRDILPNAKFVAFTGTPISKEDRKTLETFKSDGYIDVYTIKQAVDDGAIVDLYYDAGIARLDIKKAELDAEFIEKFGEESPEKQELLKREALRKYQFSTDRMESIAEHLIKHFREKTFADGFKAILVCSGRKAALRYQKIFHQLKAAGKNEFETKVVISLGGAKKDDIAKEHYATLTWNKEHPNDQKPVWILSPEEIKTATEEFKLPYGNESETEKSGAKKFDNTAILIVSDMLLTGWDAPIVSCLYLDKPLKEHTLLQAIARVNRTRKGKNAGFILDYNGIEGYLKEALEMYDNMLSVDDVWKNLNEEIPRLQIKHGKLVAFFSSIRVDRKAQPDLFIQKAIPYLEPIDRRDEFKVLLRDFNKSVNIVLPNREALPYRDDFELFNDLKNALRSAFPDDDGLKVTQLESKMLQDLINAHLKTAGVENLLDEPISILDRKRFDAAMQQDSDETKELKMRNNLKHTTQVGKERNPDFYKPLAERLEALLKEREAERIDHIGMMQALAGMQIEIIDHEKESVSKGFVTPQTQAFYDTMKTLWPADNVEISTKYILSQIASEMKIIGWQEKERVKKDILNKLVKFLKEKHDRTFAKQKAKVLLGLLAKKDA